MMRISSAYFVNDAGGGCSNAEGRETFNLTTQKCRFMGKEVREISRVFAPAVLRVSRTSLPSNLHSLVLLDLDRRADNFLRHKESLKRVCPRLRELARARGSPHAGSRNLGHTFLRDSVQIFAIECSASANTSAVLLLQTDRPLS